MVGLSDLVIRACSRAARFIEHSRQQKSAQRNFDAAIGAEFGWWLGCVGHLSVPIAWAFTSINSRNWKPSAIGPNLPDPFGRSPNPPAQLRQGGDFKGGGYGCYPQLERPPVGSPAPVPQPRHYGRAPKAPLARLKPALGNAAKWRARDSRALEQSFCASLSGCDHTMIDPCRGGASGRCFRSCSSCYPVCYPNAISVFMFFAKSLIKLVPATGLRTCDPLITNQVLYQLS